jgi:hypothetical protein
MPKELREEILGRPKITEEKLVAAWHGLMVGSEYQFDYKNHVVTEICNGDLSGFCWIRERKLTFIEKAKVWLRRNSFLKWS